MRAEQMLVICVGFNFNFISVHDELGTEAERFTLQGEVNEFNGLIHLSSRSAMRDLAGIKLKVEPADGDAFHVLARVEFGARSLRNSLFTLRSSFR